MGGIGFLSINEEGTSVSLEPHWGRLEGLLHRPAGRIGEYMLLHLKALLFQVPCMASWCCCCSFETCTALVSSAFLTPGGDR